ncbi:MAG: hypothetical protein HUU08_13875 [Candidatus Brocadia sp.]|nr:hypothetical protein [Candidatus Brocadia sp.]
MLYTSTALDGSASPSPKQSTFTGGLSDNTLKESHSGRQLSDTPAYESPSKGTPAGKVSPLESATIIQLSTESVKPVVSEAEPFETAANDFLKNLGDPQEARTRRNRQECPGGA